MKTKKTQLIKITSDSFKENILAVDDHFQTIFLTSQH